MVARVFMACAVSALFSAAEAKVSLGSLVPAMPSAPTMPTLDMKAIHIDAFIGALATPEMAGEAVTEDDKKALKKIYEDNFEKAKDWAAAAEIFVENAELVDIFKRIGAGLDEPKRLAIITQPLTVFVGPNNLAGLDAEELQKAMMDVVYPKVYGGGMCGMKMMIVLAVLVLAGLAAGFAVWFFVLKKNDPMATAQPTYVEERV